MYEDRSSCRCHRCPHLPTRPYDKREKPCLLSEYMERYPLYPITAPRGSFKPKAAEKTEDVSMEGISTTKRDYIAHKVLPRKIQQREKYVKSDKIMDLTSTYKKDYNAYSICQVPPCLPYVTRHIPIAKMDTRTTYEDDYVLWNEPRTEMIKPNNTFCPAEEAFDHRSSAQDDYVYRGPVATQSCKPMKMDEKNKPPFENMSSYRVNYVPHVLEKPYVHKYEEYKASETPFDGLTTHKASYKGLAGQPAKLAKPLQLKFPDDLPFSSATEFQEKYQTWPRLPVFRKKPAVYLPPLEKMDLHTTTQVHYKPLNGKPAKICRTFGKINKNAGPFNSCSVMKEDYKPWLCKRQEPIVHAVELTCSSEPMDCLTTFQSHYVPHPLTVTESYKPAWSRPKHTLLDAKTTYATSYTPKDIVKCLASYKDPPGYVFEGVDGDGHKLYLPASKSECPQGEY